MEIMSSYGKLSVNTSHLDTLLLNLEQGIALKWELIDYEYRLAIRDYYSNRLYFYHEEGNTLVLLSPSIGHEYMPFTERK